MANTLILPAVLITCSSLSVIGALLCLLLLRWARSEAQNFHALALQMDAELSDASRELKLAARRADDHSRRLAWLESRVRPTATDAPTLVAATRQFQSKPTITERRHRVSQLARRGMDTNAIASVLNVPHGEVELMIGLSNVA